MKRYVYFCAEKQYEGHWKDGKEHLVRVYWNFYSDGTYEKASVYEIYQNGDWEYEQESLSGMMIMKQAVRLQRFVYNEFQSLYCKRHSMQDISWQLMHMDASQKIVHETSGYLTAELEPLIQLFP